MAVLKRPPPETDTSTNGAVSGALGVIMFSISRGNVLLPFAAFSLIVVAALGTAVGFMRQHTMAQTIRQSAATEAGVDVGARCV